MAHFCRASWKVIFKVLSDQLPLKMVPTASFIAEKLTAGWKSIGRFGLSQGTLGVEAAQLKSVTDTLTVPL